MGHLLKCDVEGCGKVVDVDGFGGIGSGRYPVGWTHVDRQELPPKEASSNAPSQEEIRAAEDKIMELVRKKFGADEPEAVAMLEDIARRSRESTAYAQQQVLYPVTKTYYMCGDCSGCLPKFMPRKASPGLGA